MTLEVMKMVQKTLNFIQDLLSLQPIVQYSNYLQKKEDTTKENLGYGM